ncbi:MAG: hypothetical protein AAGJ51_03460 [Pseudomonadota bacterium]
MNEIVHFHLPRTAGSAMEAHLRKHLENSAISMRSDHFVWGDIPEHPERVFFSVLREPIDRGKSLLRYIQDNPSHRKHKRLMELGAAAWLKKFGEISQLSNGQTRQFVGSAALGRRLETQDLSFAREILKKRNVIVCTLPDLEFGLKLLSRRVGINIPNLDQHTNSSTPRSFEADVDVQLRSLNQFDIALYDEVTAHTNRMKRWWAPKNLLNRFATPN